MIGGTGTALFTVGQACCAPSRLALLGLHWWAFVLRGHQFLGALPVPMVTKRSSMAFNKLTFAAIAATAIVAITKKIPINTRRRAVFVMYRPQAIHLMRPAPLCYVLRPLSEPL